MNQLIGYLSEGEQLKGSLTIPQQLGGSTLGSKTITANGVYDAADDGVDGYDVVTANVPNTYAAGDEGKVVDNGALVSQTTATYTVNNTYDTTKINSVTVNVGGGSPTLETITKTYTPTTSQQTEQITPSSGYDGIAEVDVTVNAMPTGTEGTPTATKGAVSNHAVQVTPSVTNQAGYIAGGTKTGTAVTVSASELDSGTKSITANGTNQDVVGYAAVDVAVPNSYSAADEGKVVSNGALVAQTAHADVIPTTSDQTINPTTNNSIKVKGDADLVAANIKKDVEIFGVTGSYEGGGGTDLSWLGATTPTPSVRNFFAALANGTAEHGEFTLASTPNNAFVDLFTLTNITAPPQGIVFIDKDFYQGITGLPNSVSEACSLFWFDKSFLNPAKVGSADYVATKVTVNQTGTANGNVAPAGQFVILDGNTAVFRGKWQFTGNTFQCKFEFSNSDQYTPFLRGRTYIWIAY